MSLRCGCPDQADDIVFGERHRCTAAPKPPLDPPRLIPSWVFTVPAEDPAEPRYMETLDADERGGR
jgi:hypothetical protein